MLEADDLEEDEDEDGDLEEDEFEADDLEEDEFEADDLEEDAFEDHDEVLDDDGLEEDEFEDEVLEADDLEEDEYEDGDLEEDEYEDGDLEEDDFEADDLEEDEFEDEVLEADDLEEDEMLEDDDLGKDQTKDGPLGDEDTDKDELHNPGGPSNGKENYENQVSNETGLGSVETPVFETALLDQMETTTFNQTDMQQTSPPNKKDIVEDTESSKPSGFLTRLFGRIKPSDVERELADKPETHMPLGVSEDDLPETTDELDSQQKTGVTSPESLGPRGGESTESVPKVLEGEGSRSSIHHNEDHRDPDILSEVRVSGQRSPISTPSESVDILDENSSSAIKDDFDEIFEESDSLVVESGLVSEEAGQMPMVNPEDLGVLKYFDDSEEISDDTTSFVADAQVSTDLKDELLGFEKFLNIQSTLVNKSGSNDKSSLNLFNIDSADVKFEIVDAYMAEGNYEGAKELLSEISEQADSDKDRERAQSLLDTF